MKIIPRPEDLSSNFIQTFDLVCTIGSVALMALFCLTFWLGQDKILKILEASKVEFHRCTERNLKAVVSAHAFLPTFGSFLQ